MDRRAAEGWCRNRGGGGLPFLFSHLGEETASYSAVLLSFWFSHMRRVYDIAFLIATAAPSVGDGPYRQNNL